METVSKSHLQRCKQNVRKANTKIVSSYFYGMQMSTKKSFLTGVYNLC